MGQRKWQAIKRARPMQVYESLRRASTFPNEKLSHFDQEGAEELLYEMRNLGVSLRPTTAEYIADNNLDPYVGAPSLSPAPRFVPHACQRFHTGAHKAVSRVRKLVAVILHGLQTTRVSLLQNTWLTHVWTLHQRPVNQQ